MKLLNILFLAIKPSQFEFLEYRHTIDSQVYLSMKQHFEVTHLKLAESGFMPSNKADELFFSGKNKFFHVPFKLCRYVRKEKPEIIIVHGFTFPFQMLVLRLFLSEKTKIIIQHHAEKPFKHFIKSGIQKLAYSNVDAFLFASKGLAKTYQENKIIKNRRKIYEVMEGSTLFLPMDKAKAKALLNIEHETIFLWVGRLDENKDPFTVLKAFHKFKAAGNFFKLYMIYGSNELEQKVIDYINSHQLGNYVSLVGKKEHKDLENWYNAADYFIAASHYEGSGIALCEAMACGCIPVVTRIPSFKKMTEHGQYGLLFEPGNAHELFEKLLLLSTLNKNKMHEKILNHFKEELSLTAIGRKIETIAVSLLQK